ncbi:MAG: hypothetical protein LLF99_14150 [Desulfobacteraceae bacterium]|nr:hypothetical protein [Desulfobacteraceae bacterium]
MTICPKCGHERQPGDDHFVPKNECPKCGVIYSRFAQLQKSLDEERKVVCIRKPAGGRSIFLSMVFCACLIAGLVMQFNKMRTSQVENVDLPTRRTACTEPAAVSSGTEHEGPAGRPEPLRSVSGRHAPATDPNDSLHELSSNLEALARKYERRLSDFVIYDNQLAPFSWDAVRSEPNYRKIRSIVHNYRVQHTYMSNEFFVCVDMAMDVWNLLATSGIRSRIVVGNVQADIAEGNTVRRYLSTLNHAWVVAEVSPTAWIPLEITGGCVVEPSMLNYRLYNKGIAFENPKECKEFNTARTSMFDTCNESVTLQDNFNRSYAGRPVSNESIEYIGRMKQKANDCEHLFEKVTSFLQAR